MGNVVVYMKPKRNVEVVTENVRLKDIAAISCADSKTKQKVENIPVYHFPKDGGKRCVLSALKLIDLIQKQEKGVEVENVGEQDTLIKLIKNPDKMGPLVWVKIIFVACISFFGTAFTIMAFHNDIGIHDVFSRIYRQLGVSEAGRPGILEITYSLGLAIGIAVFFNHIGGRRITADPTPIEVEMRIYERDVDETLIETAQREEEK